MNQVALKSSLSIVALSRLPEPYARALFQTARWPDGPRCPKCSCPDLYTYTTRLLWKCKDCCHQFTVTSGTFLASHKLPLTTLLLGIALFVSGSKGVSSLQLSRMLGVNYRTAFVFAHKLRDALLQEQASIPMLSDEVEVDGAFFGGHLERFNCIDRRTGKLMSRARYGNRRVVVVARQRGGRTLTHIVSNEKQALPFIRDRVSPRSTIHADMARAWNSLRDLYAMMRISHNEGYSLNGASTNQAESFFALLRRKQMGIHHRMSGEHLGLYAAELAWRNDHKSLSEGEQVFRLLRELLTRDRGGKWVGYWQRSKPSHTGLDQLPQGVLAELRAAGLAG